VKVNEQIGSQNYPLSSLSHPVLMKASRK